MNAALLPQMLKQEVISEIFFLIWLAHNDWFRMNVLKILYLAFQADHIMWGFFIMHSFSDFRSLWHLCVLIYT